jgi:sodium-dependent dicarboxylate transporter 2/3/5
MVILAAAAAFALVASAPWHPAAPIRRAAAIVIATLILWIAEIAPLGVVALGIPIAAAATGLLAWPQAVAVWGDPIIFLNLGAFLLARALDKHGAFDWLLASRWLSAPEPAARGGAGRTFAVFVASGSISTVQNNTAVTAMLLPVVSSVARRSARPAAVLMALSLGATLGGMATPIGTAPNFLGYGAMKKLSDSVSFISWMRVGLAVWFGGAVASWLILTVASRFAPRQVRADEARAKPAFDVPLIHRADESAAERRIARRWSLAALALAAALWIGSGVVIGVTPPDSRLRVAVETYLPESLVPIAAALMLFVIRPRPGGPAVLDRRDFLAIDWDTLFLFGGGLCLGRLLDASGAAAALAGSVAQIHFSPTLTLLAVAGATVLLSEVTSNTATAGAIGMPAVQVIQVVALAASLGFALPVSTPPNALIYGTGLIPLRWMVCVGLAVDVVCLVWVVLCARILG